MNRLLPALLLLIPLSVMGQGTDGLDLHPADGDGSSQAYLSKPLKQSGSGDNGAVTNTETEKDSTQKPGGKGSGYSSVLGGAAALQSAAFGNSGALKGQPLPDNCTGGDCLPPAATVDGAQVKAKLAQDNAKSVGEPKLPDGTRLPTDPNSSPNVTFGTDPQAAAIRDICPDCPPPPPQMTLRQHPVPPEVTQAYQTQLQTRLEERSSQAEANGDASTASLLSAYASKPDRAARLAERALADNPADRNALTAMMLARQQQGRGDESRELARRVLAADPNNAIAKIVAGAEGNLDKGAALQKKFGKMDLGKTAETDGLSGGLMGLFGGRPAADDAGRRAGQAGAAAALPQAAGGGIVHPAAPVYDVTQPLTPAQQLVLRAVHKHEIGDEQGAMLALTEAIDRDPKDAGAFVVRAEVDNTLTKYAEAVLDATKAVDLAPSKPVLTARALRARAYANLELKQWVQALADASRAVDQDPQNGLGYLYRAMAEDKLGRGTAAADDLSNAVKADPALTPLARPLMIKYGLQQAPSKSGRRSWPVLFVFVGGASLLLAYGMRKLVAGPRLTTSAAQRLRESTPVP